MPVFEGIIIFGFIMGRAHFTPPARPLLLDYKTPFPVSQGFIWAQWPLPMCSNMKFQNRPTLMVTSIFLKRDRSYYLSRNKCIPMRASATNQGGRGQWAVYYTSPQSFMSTFSRWLTNFGDFHWILIGWFIKMSVQNFSSNNCILKKG